VELGAWMTLMVVSNTQHEIIKSQGDLIIFIFGKYVIFRAAAVV